ncbi:amidohydrolase family protein [Halorussus ruber]|uniref:amidohydrolase family protein n=1 Tax=Halorussus ruber TaxID=1126238 RepID=UPI001091FB35|nr:amidohydrolase family protein [Halorussus ruber]
MGEVDNDGPIVFDTDFHLNEGMEHLVPYLVDPYKTLYERDYGEEYRDPFPQAGWFAPDRMGKQSPRQVQTREDVSDAMAEFDIDYALIQPSNCMHLGSVHHDEFATALANAYNEWASNEILDSEKGIYGSILVAPQRPETAAAEIRDRKDADEFVSVGIPSGGVHPPLGNRRYHPIYEAAEEAGLPIVMHNAVTTIMTAFPQLFQEFSRNLTCHATLHPMQQMVHLADMIVQGIPVEFPNLKIVMQEAGVGWIPFMMRRLDNEYLNHRSDAPMLEKMPSEYIEDQFYFSSQPFEAVQEQKYVEYVVELVGSDSLMFATDYPHFDFDNTEDVMNRLQRLPEAEREKIAGKTALDVFDIDQHD